jgi:hypothetical protein
MRPCLALIVAAGLSFVFTPDAMAQGKKRGATKAECLNPLVCGPQKVPQRRKPAKEQFMRSAS